MGAMTNVETCPNAARHEAAPRGDRRLRRALFPNFFAAGIASIDKNLLVLLHVKNGRDEAGWRLALWAMRWRWAA